MNWPSGEVLSSSSYSGKQRSRVHYSLHRADSRRLPRPGGLVAFVVWRPTSPPPWRALNANLLSYDALCPIRRRCLAVVVERCAWAPVARAYLVYPPAESVALFPCCVSHEFWQSGVCQNVHYSYWEGIPELCADECYSTSRECLRWGPPRIPKTGPENTAKSTQMLPVVVNNAETATRPRNNVPCSSHVKCLPEG